MAYEPKPGQGSAFRNREEGKPDYSGSILLPDGTAAFLDIWRKESAKGDEYLSVRVKPRNKQPERSPPPPSQREQRHAAYKGDPSDAIPF